jgi:hypothetical protein
MPSVTIKYIMLTVIKPNVFVVNVVTPNLLPPQRIIGQEKSFMRLAPQRRRRQQGLQPPRSASESLKMRITLARKSYCRGRINTADLLVITTLDAPFYIENIIYF